MTTETRFAVDWLTFTAFTSDDRINMILQEWLVTDLVAMGHGGRGYQKISSNAYGLKVYSEPIQNRKTTVRKDGHGEDFTGFVVTEQITGENYFTIEIPSEALQVIGIQPIMRVLDGLMKSYRVNVNRLDLAADHQHFTPAQFWRYLEDCVNDDISDAELITRVRRENIRRVCDLAGEGDTVYMGARKGSQAMLRVYKKTIENDELFQNDPFCRVELELKGQRATMALYQMLMSKPDDWHNHYKALLNGMFQITWTIWINWLDTAKKFWLRLVKFRPSFERASKWLHNQVAPTLAMYIAAMWEIAKQDEKRTYSDDELRDIACAQLVVSGKKRLKTHQHSVIKAAGRKGRSINAKKGRVLLSDGREWDQTVQDASMFMGLPAGKFAHGDVHEWLQKYIYSISQLELTGVNWDDFKVLHNWTHYEI